MNRTLGLFMIVTLVCSARVRAEGVESSQLAIKLKLGVGGTVDAISSATVVQSGAAASESLKSGSRVSYGFEAQHTASLSRYFAVGAALGYLSWRGARSAIVGPRNWLLDFAVLPEGRWKVADSVLLYVTVPVGLSLDMLNEIESLPDGPGNPALGFLVGGLIGARLHIANRIGLFGELGYVYRNFSHELSVPALDGFVLPTRERRDITISFGQFALNVGLCVFF